MFEFIAWDSSQLKSVHSAYHLSFLHLISSIVAVAGASSMRQFLITASSSYVLDLQDSTFKLHKSKSRKNRLGEEVERCGAFTCLINNLVSNNYALGNSGIKFPYVLIITITFIHSLRFFRL